MDNERKKGERYAIGDNQTVAIEAAEIQATYTNGNTTTTLDVKAVAVEETD